MLCPAQHSRVVSALCQVACGRWLGGCARPAPTWRRPAHRVGDIPAKPHAVPTGAARAQPMPENVAIRCAAATATQVCHHARARACAPATRTRALTARTRAAHRCINGWLRGLVGDALGMSTWPGSDWLPTSRGLAPKLLGHMCRWTHRSPNCIHIARAACRVAACSACARTGHTAHAVHTDSQRARHHACSILARKGASMGPWRAQRSGAEPWRVGVLGCGRVRRRGLHAVHLHKEMLGWRFVGLLRRAIDKQPALDQHDTLPEWSKGAGSSSTSASCACSKPTGASELLSRRGPRAHGGRAAPPAALPAAMADSMSGPLGRGEARQPPTRTHGAPFSYISGAEGTELSGGGCALRISPDHETWLLFCGACPVIANLPTSRMQGRRRAPPYRSWCRWASPRAPQLPYDAARRGATQQPHGVHRRTHARVHWHHACAQVANALALKCAV